MEVKNKRADELGKQIRGEFEIWNHIYHEGANDPFWEDGVNLEITRNHIISYKRECEAELLPEQYPPEYSWELPPVVDRKYMARAEDIKSHAELSLKAYESDVNYQYLKANARRLTEIQKDETCVLNVIGYVIGLQRSIKNVDFVTMRRHEHPEHYQELFLIARKRIESILGSEKILPQGQLSLFDLFEM